ncbi:MAG: HYR domain-containing protein [Saprospiraceae bacterium]
MRTILSFLLLISLAVFASAETPKILGVLRAANFSSVADSVPQITCPANGTLFLTGSSCTVPHAYSVTVTDDHPGWTLSQTAGYASGEAFPVGKSVNAFLVTDIAGNTATCSFSVAVWDTIAPVANCATNVVVTLGADDPNDCYNAQVGWFPVSLLNNGSSDNCGSIFITGRRTAPYSDCVNALNPVKGHPECDWNIDPFPHFPSEFEQAISEKDSIKIYCCEQGYGSSEPLTVWLQVYQMDSLGNFAKDQYGDPIFGTCTTVVTVDTLPCVYADHQLTGSLQLDSNNDCIANAGLFNMPQITVRAVRNGTDTLYTTSNGLFGFFSFGNVDTGTYILDVLPPPGVWQVCNNTDTVVILPTTQGAGSAFVLQPLLNCPVLYTDVAADLTRPCRPGIWSVYNCNIGGAAATDAVLRLLVDDRLVILDVSEPYTLSGDTLVIPLGDIAPGDCKNIQLTMEAICDTTVIGEHLCVEARIYPDTVCLHEQEPWSGAQIEADVQCTGDSIYLNLRNAGIGSTTEELPYIVIDDMVIMRTGTIPTGFQPGATIQEVVYADGKTYRISARQEPGHPVPRIPNIALDDCNGLNTPSQLLAFMNEDGNPFTDLECRLVVASYDPNEKLGFPLGFSDNHLIEPNTPLSYQLGFQNTGNDTAFLVVLRDTLSPLLNPGTLRMGAASHPYTWTLEGPGYLTVRFDNILLPDSFVNEPASHGFVRFDIEQKRDNPIGSVIENRAGIYFDINSVVLTNTVFHTLGLNFVPVATVEPDGKRLLYVFPNPATDRLYLPLETDARVRLYDPLGHLVREYAAEVPGLYLQRDGLANGLYLLEVFFPNGEVRSGKVLWQGGK